MSNIYSEFFIIAHINNISGISEEGEDAFAAMRRAKKNVSLKGRGTKMMDVPKEDLVYGLEKVGNGLIQ